MRLSDEDIRGRVIIAADGQVVGEIDTILFEADGGAWHVEALGVTLRKDVADALGAHRDMFHSGKLEIPTHMVQSVGTTVVLSVPVGGLRAALPSEGEQAPSHG